MHDIDDTTERISPAPFSSLESDCRESENADLEQNSSHTVLDAPEPDELPDDAVDKVAGPALGKV